MMKYVLKVCCSRLWSTSAGCLLPSARVWAEPGLWKLSAGPVQELLRRETKQQSFPRALLRPCRKYAGEFGQRAVAGHLHSNFCSVFCPSRSHFLSLWGEFLRAGWSSVLARGSVSVGSSPWQLWIYYTASFEHLFSPLQRAMWTSFLVVSWVRARLGETELERWTHLGVHL